MPTQYSTDMVKQMLLGKDGQLAPLIKQQEAPAHPHLHVGPDQSALEKETTNRFKNLASGSQTTGFLYAHQGNFDRLAEALARAFNSYLANDIANLAHGGSSKSWSGVLDLSDFRIGRARVEEGTLDKSGVRVTITRAEDVDAQNFFLKLVRPPAKPVDWLARCPILQTTYPTDAAATVKKITKIK